MRAMCYPVNPPLHRIPYFTRLFIPVTMVATPIAAAVIQDRISIPSGWTKKQWAPVICCWTYKVE